VDHLRDIGPRFHLDLNRAIVIGHSSGGQLGLWLAARRKLAKDSILFTSSPLSLKGVIVIDGPPDLAAFRSIEQPMCGGPVVTKFMGGAPAEFPGRYREGSATGQLPIGVKQEFFTRANPAQLNALVEQYVEAAEKVSDPVRRFTLHGESHFDGINPQAPGWQAVLASVRWLLRNP